MESDNFNTRVAYRDADAWTSERGAAKFLDQIVASTYQEQYQGYGCVLNGFTVTPGTGLAVKINDADGTDAHCLIKYNEYSYLCWLQQPYNLVLSAADQGLPRISLIVAYVDLTITFEAENKVVESPNVMKFKAIDGAPASNPQAPSVGQIQSEVGLNNPYIVLAEVTVPAGASSISVINDLTSSIKAKLSPALGMDPENSYVAGVLQVGTQQKTRIVVTGPTGIVQPIPGVEIIWLRKKR